MENGCATSWPDTTPTRPQSGSTCCRLGRCTMTLPVPWPHHFHRRIMLFPNSNCVRASLWGRSDTNSGAAQASLGAPNHERNTVLFSSRCQSRCVPTHACQRVSGRSAAQDNASGRLRCDRDTGHGWGEFCGHLLLVPHPPPASKPALGSALIFGVTDYGRCRRSTGARPKEFYNCAQVARRRRLAKAPGQAPTATEMPCPQACDNHNTAKPCAWQASGPAWAAMEAK